MPHPGHSGNPKVHIQTEWLSKDRRPADLVAPATPGAEGCRCLLTGCVQCGDHWRGQSRSTASETVLENELSTVQRWSQVFPCHMETKTTFLGICWSCHQLVWYLELRSAGHLVFHLEHSPPFTMSFILDHPGHLMIRNSLAYLPLLLLERCGYGTSLKMQLCHLFKILLPWRLLMAVLPQLKCIWANKMLFRLQRFHLHIVFWIHTCCLQYWFPFCVPEILKLHRSISEDQDTTRLVGLWVLHLLFNQIHSGISH